MTQEERNIIEGRIVDVIKTVYDPEIPVNIYDLGMIYRIEVLDDGAVELDMTFTAPNCPAADFILEDVRTKVESVEGRSPRWIPTAPFTPSKQAPWYSRFSRIPM